MSTSLLLGNTQLPLPAGLVPVGSFFGRCGSDHGRTVSPLIRGGIINRRVCFSTAPGRGMA